MKSGRDTVWELAFNKQPLFEKLKFFLMQHSLKKMMAKSKKDLHCIDILDVGCGYHGNMLRALSKSARSVTGLDFNIDEELFSRDRINSIVGDAEKVLCNVPEQSFDVVYMLSVLEHVNDPVKLLKEVRRVLRPTGVFFVNSPSWFGKFILERVVLPYFDSSGSYKIQVDTHKRYFSNSSLWQVLIDSGFVSSEVKIAKANFFCSVSACITKRNDAA